MWKSLDTREKRILTRYFSNKANKLHTKLSTLLIIGVILTIILLINGTNIRTHFSTNLFGIVFMIISTVGIIFPATCLIIETPIYKYVYMVKNNQMFITEAMILSKHQYKNIHHLTCKVGKTQKKIKISETLYDKTTVKEKIYLVTPDTTHIEPVFVFDTQFKNAKSISNKKKRSA